MRIKYVYMPKYREYTFEEKLDIADQLSDAYYNFLHRGTTVEDTVFTNIVQTDLYKLTEMPDRLLIMKYSIESESGEETIQKVYSLVQRKTFRMSKNLFFCRLESHLNGHDGEIYLNFNI